MTGMEGEGCRGAGMRKKLSARVRRRDVGQGRITSRDGAVILYITHDPKKGKKTEKNEAEKTKLQGLFFNIV